MRMRWRRLLGLVTIAVCVAGAVILAALARSAGWPATRDELVTLRVDAEARIWPPLSRVVSRFSPDSSADERAVWRTLVELYPRGPDGRVLPIAVDEVARWSDPESPDELRSRVIAGWGANDPGNPEAAVAVADFLARNNRSAFLDCGTMPPNVRCVRHSELAKHAREFDGWDRFSAENGGVVSYLAMSRVGFDFGHAHAVVYAAQSGVLCGGGGYFVLAREKSAWRIIAYHMKWVS